MHAPKSLGLGRKVGHPKVDQGYAHIASPRAAGASLRAIAA